MVLFSSLSKNIIKCVLVSFFLFGVLIKVCPDEQNVLYVYSYDSFSDQWGLGKIATQLFSDAPIKIISVGDTIDMLYHAKSFGKKDRQRPDIVFGIANITIPLARDLGFLQRLSSGIAYPVFREGITVVDNIMVPYDFGYIAIVYDSKYIKNPPTDFEDLTSDRFKKKLVLIDPRTSGPGLAFLYWTIAVYGNAFTEYWKRLSSSIMTMPDSWSTAYGLFTAGETPMVLSYTTSPIYHQVFEKENRYKVALFPEGHYRYVEYVAIPTIAAHKHLAEQFIKFILSKDFQKKILLGNVMYPAVKDIPLPSMAHQGMPMKALELDYTDIAQHKDTWIRDWLSVMSERR